MPRWTTTSEPRDVAFNVRLTQSEADEVEEIKSLLSLRTRSDVVRLAMSTLGQSKSVKQARRAQVDDATD